MAAASRRCAARAGRPHGQAIWRSSAAGASLVLTLARPDRRNSLSEVDAGRAAGGDRRRCAQTRRARASCSRPRARVFCAGHDLKELTAHRADADGGRAYHRQADAPVRRHDAGDRALPEAGDRRGAGHGARPPAASWSPPAIWRSPSQEATFCTPGVNIGLFCSTPMVALSRNVLAQARHGDAAAGRDAAGASRPPSTASSTAWCPPDS